MKHYRKCGEDSQRKPTKDGCSRLFPIRDMKRCWQCGVLLCESCYSEHRHEPIQWKGGEK